MIKLTRHSNWPDEIQLRSPEAVYMVKRTEEIFTVDEDNRIFMVGGLYPGSMLTNSAYAWIVTDRPPTDVFSVRQGLKLAKNYLTSLNRKIYAEVNPAADSDVKFLKLLGFTKDTEYDGRHRYEWSA